ncbi:transcription initiation factor IIE subunit beta-like isoform X2 [Anneissia japonica]|nr:transcription initiation factor IIE subunit beta-like isoform X2 [Anneissia japonica]XP_033112339.1 transcription initiation factor IIE subunit beta-like isoform X2 [Anneissia japonica]XP_033112340.1 transcription initiation factor IIE subunit beta-like isoform X2 [Anneissia japonica]
MEKSLLDQHEAFHKRKLAVPVIEKRKPKTEAGSQPPTKKKRPIPDFRNDRHNKNRGAISGHGGFNYKMFQGTSKNKFKILANIINFMRDRFKRGCNYSLTVDEILDETNMLDVSTANKAWLTNDALPNNPKITVEDGGYKYKPKFSIRGKKELLRLLDNHDQHGKGGILLDEVIDSLPHAEKKIEDLGDQVIIVTRPLDKKKVLFYNDKDCQLEIDEEFKKLWRSIAVDSIDENKIDEYLKKQGITSMQDSGVKKFTPVQKRRKGGKKRKIKQLLNEHVADQLKDYTEDNNGQ